MSKVVNYDFIINSIVTVEALAGTDPDTLHDKVFVKLAQQAKEHQLVLEFDTIFDSATGEYEEDWEVYIEQAS
tara:strand:+ start:214 stop:432 length:219 start_codon:yes stop_codon:yes gene_type:complete